MKQHIMLMITAALSLPMPAQAQETAIHELEERLQTALDLAREMVHVISPDDLDQRADRLTSKTSQKIYREHYAQIVSALAQMSAEVAIQDDPDSAANNRKFREVFALDGRGRKSLVDARLLPDSIPPRFEVNGLRCSKKSIVSLAEIAIHEAIHSLNDPSNKQNAQLYDFRFETELTEIAQTVAALWKMESKDTNLPVHRPKARFQQPPPIDLGESEMDPLEYALKFQGHDTSQLPKTNDEWIQRVPEQNAAPKQAIRLTTTHLRPEEIKIILSPEAGKTSSNYSCSNSDACSDSMSLFALYDENGAKVGELSTNEIHPMKMGRYLIRWGNFEKWVALDQEGKIFDVQPILRIFAQAQNSATSTNQKSDHPIKDEETDRFIEEMKKKATLIKEAQKIIKKVGWFGGFLN